MKAKRFAAAAAALTIMVSFAAAHDGILSDIMPTTITASALSGTGTKYDPYVPADGNDLYDLAEQLADEYDEDPSVAAETVYIRIDSDMNCSPEFYYRNLDIDLNGHTIASVGNINFYEGCSAYLHDGTIYRGAVYCSGKTTLDETLVMENVTVISSWAAVVSHSYDITINNCSLESGLDHTTVRLDPGKISINDSTIKCSEAGRLFSRYYGTTITLDGVVIDPSAFEDFTEYNGLDPILGVDGKRQATGTYIDGGAGDPDIVYSVDLAWSSMDFVYNEAKPGTWNPDTLKYEGNEKAHWSDDSEPNGLIMVVNASNAPINVGYSFTTDIEGLEAEFSEIDYSNGTIGETVTQIEIPSADKYSEDVSAGYRYQMVRMNLTGGKPTETEKTKIGTITVTIDSVKEAE